MEDDRQIEVGYLQEGPDGHLLSLGSEALADLRIDYAGIPENRRGGTAVRLLCASALYCFASTLGAALRARKAIVKGMRGKATALKEKDEVSRTKVTEIAIEVEVDLADSDVPVLEKCREIMKRGCLVTYSLEDAIEIRYEIRRA